MLRLAARIAAGPLLVPCSDVVVRCNGPGKITARAFSYWDSDSEIPPKLSGGIGVYRVIGASRSLFFVVSFPSGGLTVDDGERSPRSLLFQGDSRTNAFLLMLPPRHSTRSSTKKSKFYFRFQPHL